MIYPTSARPDLTHIQPRIRHDTARDRAKSRISLCYNQ